VLSCQVIHPPPPPPIFGGDSVFEVFQVSPPHPFYENIIKMHKDMQLWRNNNESIKSKYSDKPCPRATLSSTNLTWNGPGRNPGPRDVQLAITSLILNYIYIYIK